MGKEEKQELTLEDLKKQVEDVKTQITTLQEENTSLKEKLQQKELEITKLSLGGITKQNQVTKEVEEDVTFDFDF